METASFSRLMNMDDVLSFQLLILCFYVKYIVCLKYNILLSDTCILCNASYLVVLDVVLSLYVIVC